MKWKTEKEGQRWEAHQYKGKYLKISIHHHIDHDEKEWLLSYYAVLDSRPITLKGKSVEDAKNEGVALVKRKLELMLSDLD